MYGRIQKEIEIPEAVTCTLKGSEVTIKGELGSLTKDFTHTGIKITFNDNILTMTTLFPKKKEKALLGTVVAHINNMINGVTLGYKYSMKIVFSHFPIKVSTSGTTVKVENLYGGRKPKFAKALPDVKIKLDGENLFVSGIDKEHVGQTCANIQELTRLRGSRRKSPKTFMDGIFTYDKSGTMV